MPVVMAAAAALAGEEGSEVATTQVETITRTDFIEEFIDRMDAGDHSLFLGPTGVGKSTVMRDLIDAGPPIPNIGVLMPKGPDTKPDEPFFKIGKQVDSWPTGIPMAWHKWNQESPPYVWTQVGNARAGYGPLRGQFEPTLRWARGRRDWLWVFPDLQSMSDRKFANCGGEIEWLTLTLRKFGSSLWYDTQRASWIPRAAEDQVRNVILFRNPDRDSVERLREVISLPMNEIMPLMEDMANRGKPGRHDFLWRDSFENDLFYVIGDK